MYTIKEEDLDFNAPFHLVCRRHDYVQAFVTFFTIGFSKCHMPTGFSTGTEMNNHKICYDLKLN